LPVSRKGRWLACCIYFTVWTVLLLIPGRIIETIPGGETLETLKFVIAKTIHVFAYGGMAILFGWLQLPARFRWILVFLLMTHSTLTELAQRYVIPGRTGELRDVGINTLGIAAGLLLSWKWWVKRD
jgi:VanZ family protein